MPAKHGSEWTGRHSGKDRLRARVWSALKKKGAAARDPFGRIPSFVGAEKAAALLASLPIWSNAKVIKCNPDAPQAPVRLRALQDGKLLYMAVPRLSKMRCFVELRAEDLQRRRISLERAVKTRQAVRCGRLVTFEEMTPIDLVVTGCVAVTRDGGRAGKGAGFADLELGMLKEAGLVGQETPIVTTVHQLQVVESSSLPMQRHDWALDWVVTPEEAIETHAVHPRPKGLDWDAIRPDQLETIPVLRKLKAERKLGR